jgi:flagellar hook assembly protein FlgD
VLNQNVFRPGQGQPLVISLKAPQNGRVSVRVFNISGELVRTPFEADVQAGLWYQAQWNGENPQGEKVSAGIYFISVRGAGIHRLRKVILMK